MTRRAVALGAVLAFANCGASAAAVPDERAYARTVTPLSAADVTANLRGVVGKRVAFTCSVVSIVDARTMIGQCGKDIEPVDLYVHLATARLHPGERLRVLGEMETPAVWVDVTGHPWYTGFVRARFIERR